MGIDLSGSYDLHVHTAPDIVERKLTDIKAAQMALAEGMRGLVIKNHAFPTMARASVVRELYPELDVIGAITLNQTMGGIHAEPVEAAAKMGARIVWFPTMDAREYLLRERKALAQPGLSGLDANGQLIPQAWEVLEIAKKYDMVVGTGHLGVKETKCLIEAGHKMGLTRMVATHVTLPVCQMDIDQLKFCVENGATIEFSYCHVLSKKCSIEYVSNQIKGIGAKNAILTSDLGQKNNPYPIDGMKSFCEMLLQHGITHEEIDWMIKKNPYELLYK